MISGFRDILARPLQAIRRPSRAPAYIRVVDTVRDDDESRISGEVDGLEAVRQAIWHIVHTERYSWAGCLPNEGIELEQFIGRGFGYFSTKIEQVLQDALLQDNRILSVKVIEKIHNSPTSAFCKLETQSVYGRIVQDFDIPLVAQ